MTLFASVLLVEDEPNLAKTLRLALKKLGIPTTHVTTLKHAEEHIRTSPPELVLLDRGLPDGDGIDLCTQLRAEGFDGCILILTAAGDLEQRVEGLNQGADDYLPKPFSWSELEARIRALSRRHVTYAKRPASSAPVFVPPAPELWTLDAQRLRVQGPRGWAELTPLEFKLASRLIGAGGAILTRDELLKDVWGFQLLPKTRTVDHFLGRLRKRFERNPEAPEHFLTVRGAGYRFTL
jgi:DNA-binding response OmpR family regulator